MKIVYPQDFLKRISRKHLLLDTSFFIDATYADNEVEFDKFIKLCSENEVTLVTISLVEAEFLKGTESLKKISSKRRLINSIVDTVLSITPDIYTDFVPYLIEQYKGVGKGISITDLVLGAVKLRHKTDLLLLTKNPKDFPEPIFSLHTYFLMKKKQGVQVYAALDLNSENNKKTNFTDIPPF